ncbi:Ig-like domain-containing protein [Bacillus horti]|uniref:BIG2 domain-containing protein n=1 Tax=Caldalkalibacillus horti TaxID=77523 RepID=A0ABT9VTS0_9BACI|nr:Ig-like domain-containing protein [Bacillus horti]MDQ0164285.1 hypothetical protein [Bacillus horti]
MSQKKHWSRVLLVAAILVFVLLPTHAWAKDGDVTAIEFEDPSDVHLYIEETTEQLKLLATVEGKATEEDVTKDAVWTSSNAQIVKVDKGLLTPLKNGTVTITAKYKGFTATLKATSEYLYKELKLSSSEPIEYELGSKDLKLEAFAVEEDDTENDVTDKAAWSTSNNKVLTVSNGNITLVGTGKATITATYKGLSKSIQVTVSSPYSKLELEPGNQAELLVGDETTVIQAIATLKNGTQENVTAEAVWSTSDAKVATVSEGEITPLAIGRTTITVNYLGVSTQLTVLVRTPYEVMVLSPANDWNVFLNEGPFQVTASVMNSPDQRRDVTQEATWSSTNELAVTVQNGTITPKAVGTATVKVVYKGLTKEIKVTVQPTIKGLESNTDTIELFKNEIINVPKIQAVTLDDKKLDFTKDVEWISSDETIASVENGKLTAKQTGEVQLTAKIRDFTHTIDVSIQEKVLLLLSSQETISIITGSEASLPNVLAVRENGVEEDVTNKIEWKLTGSRAVIVEDQIKGYLKGNVRLEGTYLNQSIRIPVAIEEEIVKIEIGPSEVVDVNLNRSQSIRVTGYYNNGKKVNLSSKVNWSVANPAIAELRSRSVRGVSEGTTKLTGSYQDIPLEVTVNVVARLKKLEASERRIQLSQGGTATVVINALYDTNATENVTNTVSWTTNRPNVAKVENGRIQAVGKGTATIRATMDKKSVTIRVTVK